MAEENEGEQQVVDVGPMHRQEQERQIRLGRGRTNLKAQVLTVSPTLPLHLVTVTHHWLINDPLSTNMLW